jgi:predicted MFS family arabinose efflux permease
MHALVSAFRDRNLWFVGGFLFLYYFSPGFGTPLYFQMTDRLHFSQGFIGLLSAVSAGGWILGGVLYTLWLRRMPQTALLRLSIIAGMVTTLMYLGLGSPVSAVMIWLAGGIASMVAMVATMSLAADACPQGAEGFAFAALMSILNLTYPLHDTIGSALYEHVFDRQLAPLVIVSAVATGAVFFLTPLVADRKAATHPVTIQ